MANKKHGKSCSICYLIPGKNSKTPETLCYDAVDTMKKTPRYPGNLLPGGIGDLFSIILIECVLLNCFFTHISDRSDIIA